MVNIGRGKRSVKRHVLVVTSDKSQVWWRYVQNIENQRKKIRPSHITHEIKLIGRERRVGMREGDGRVRYNGRRQSGRTLYIEIWTEPTCTYLHHFIHSLSFIFPYLSLSSPMPYSLSHHYSILYTQILSSTILKFYLP